MPTNSGNDDAEESSQSRLRRAAEDMERSLTNSVLDDDAPNDIDSHGGPTVGANSGQIKEPAKSPMHIILIALGCVLFINVPLIISFASGFRWFDSFGAFMGLIVFSFSASVLVLLVGVVVAITRADRRSVLDDDAPNDIDSHRGPTVSEDGKPSDASSERVIERAPRFSVGRTIFVTLLVVTWLSSVAEGGLDDGGFTLFVACFTLFPGILLVVGGLSQNKKVRLASTRAAMIVPGLPFLYILVKIYRQGFLVGTRCFNCHCFIVKFPDDL